MVKWEFHSLVAHSNIWLHVAFIHISCQPYDFHFFMSLSYYHFSSKGGNKKNIQQAIKKQFRSQIKISIYIKFHILYILVDE